MLDPTLRLGPTSLTVTDLDRSVAWYQRALGLRPMGDGRLGDGEEVVLELVEDAQAVPPGRSAGLYHVALLFPSREELSRVALRLARTQTPIQGASDHGTHEAIYLADPDGNGLELAADRPREAWPKGLGYAGGPAPLDVQGLLAVAADEPPADVVGPGLRTGHLHLHVGDIGEGLAFYRDLVGFEEQANLGTAAFVSAGGYHHHLGFNVWNGVGVGPPPARSTGLRHWTVVLPEADAAALRERAGADDDGLVRDPWGSAFRVVAA
jgi:catechol 2,3-dioxygenase